MTKGLERHVRNTLRNFAKFSENKYARADYAASDILIDLDKAVYESGMTDKQVVVLKKLYEDHLTTDEAAECIGIARRTVAYHEANAISLIAEALKRGGDSY